MFKRKMTKKCSTEITKRFLKELINNISKGRLKKKQSGLDTKTTKMAISSKY